MHQDRKQWQFSLAHLFAVTTIVACLVALGIPALIGLAGFGLLLAVSAVVLTPDSHNRRPGVGAVRAVNLVGVDHVATFRDEPEQTQFAAELPVFMQHGWFLDSLPLTEDESAQLTDERDESAQLTDERFVMYDKEEAAATRD